MAETEKSLSDKVEQFVEGIVRFIGRYARAVYEIAFRPRRFVNSVARLRNNRQIVRPLTFLLVGCFLLSMVIDVYPEGWQIYFNWLWLQQEIQQRLNERGADIFSLTAVVKAGLPTFLAFAGLSLVLARVSGLPSLIRQRLRVASLYAFGFHAVGVSVAVLLPILATSTLNPDTTDALASEMWAGGFHRFIQVLTGFIALSAVVSPIALLWLAAIPRHPVPLRRVLALPFAVVSFGLSLVVAAELASLPARFGIAMKIAPEVEYQALGTPTLAYRAADRWLRAEFGVILYNKTDDLAYVDGGWGPVVISMSDAESALAFESDPVTTLFDGAGAAGPAIPLPPGQARTVRLVTTWTLAEPLGQPSSEDDSALTYDDMAVSLDYDFLSGATLAGDLDYNLTGVTFQRLP